MEFPFIKSVLLFAVYASNNFHLKNNYSESTSQCHRDVIKYFRLSYTCINRNVLVRTKKSRNEVSMRQTAKNSLHGQMAKV